MEKKKIPESNHHLLDLQTRQPAKHTLIESCFLCVHFFFYPLENAFHKIIGEETKQLCLCR